MAANFLKTIWNFIWTLMKDPKIQRLLWNLLLQIIESVRNPKPNDNEEAKTV